MTPEFDEEVVFENSPLYQYLQDLGHTDFEICASLSPKPEKCLTTEGPQPPPTRVLEKQGILKDDLLHKLDTGFRLDSLHTILQQEVLLQEDVELIELLDPSILSAGQPQQENGHLPTLCSLATPNIWDVSVLFAFVSLLIMFPTCWIVSSWLVWGMILFLYLIIRALKLWRTAKLQMTLKRYRVLLEDMAASSRAFTNLVRKSLRLIQETEVISRGFTLTSDNVTNYICVVPFKELGLGLSEDQISEEEARNLTDGFSLPALKNGANSPSGPTLAAALLPHRLLWDVTQGLPHAHSACLGELKRSYEFFRHFETQHQAVPQRLSKTQQKSRELNNVHTAVRSLQLHLKALLNEVIILEDELEKLVCTKETQELLSDAYPVLEQKLKLIEPHVQASNSCWEEAVSQVDKLLRRKSDKKGKPGVACENPHCTAAPLLRPTLHIEDRDPIPEEQELEAYVDDIDIESEFRKDDVYHLSQEDRERQKREQEESRRVLQELKSVLGFKASEAERQKWKQLLFSDHDPVESVSNSETHVNSDSEKVNSNAPEETSKACASDQEDSRTEYVCDGPPEGQSTGAPADEGLLLRGAEETACSEQEREARSPQAAAAGTTAPLTPEDSLQLSIKQRLARLQLSPEFTFSAGLAAEVAARSLSFTNMQEQTFGDEEEEQLGEGGENEAEEK
ncbi:Vezatin [Apodemus speciosus]|uniref:Vezatin n=1 Tax=Apodemus speciosus TaxID=105296 RepID=A0ABQ0F8D7_APOSI